MSTQASLFTAFVAALAAFLFAGCENLDQIVADGRITTGDLARAGNSSDGDSESEDESSSSSSDESSSSSSNDSSSSSSSERKDSARVELSGELESNPIVLKNLQSYGLKGKYDFDRFEIGDRGCKGDYPKEPNVVVEIEKKYEALKFVPSDGWSMLANPPNGPAMCAYSNIGGQKNWMKLTDVEPGTYEFYIATRDRKETVAFNFSIENLGQPRTLEWTEADIPTATLNGNASEVQMFTRVYSDEERKNMNELKPGRGCSELFVDKPDLRIEVEKRSTFVLGQRYTYQGSTQLIGPMPEDNRDLPTKCWEDKEDKMTLEPGTYYLWRMSKEGDFPSFQHYYIRPPEQENPPVLAMFDRIPKSMPLEERRITNHFPFTTQEVDPLARIKQSDRVKRELFLKAPKQLFAAVRVDLDKHTASARPHPFIISSDNEVLREDAPTTYPEKGEPVLMLDLDGTILAADGSVYQVQRKDLVPAEKAESIELVDSPRNPQLAQWEVMRLAPEEDQDLVEKVERRDKRYDKCADRVWDQVEPRLRRLRDKMDDEPNQARAQIRRVKSRTEKREERQCGLDALTSLRKRTAKTLLKRRETRRKEALETINSRLKKLFDL